MAQQDKSASFEQSCGGWKMPNLDGASAAEPWESSHLLLAVLINVGSAQSLKLCFEYWWWQARQITGQRAANTPGPLSMSKMTTFKSCNGPHREAYTWIKGDPNQQLRNPSRKFTSGKDYVFYQREIKCQSLFLSFSSLSSFDLPFLR